MADQPNNLKNEASDSEELKRYLFYEASDAERGQIEERFFDDDELFYELLDLENDLTDRYARNELGDSDKKRFAASLEKSPERRVKLANANALQSFIKAESVVPTPLAIEKEPSNFWERFNAFFGLNAANFQFAAAALLFLLLAGIGFLIYERQRNAGELARLRESENQRTAQIEQQEAALREQLEKVRESERNLQTELGGERGQTEILNEQLSREQAEKARLTREIEALRKQKQLPVLQPIAPTIATTVFLSPIGGKGNGGEVKTVRLSPNATTVSATLQIPKESVAETFSVRLNSALLGENIKLRSTKSGNNFITVNLPAKSLSFESENLLTATGDDGSRYNFALRRRQ